MKLAICPSLNSLQHKKRCYSRQSLKKKASNPQVNCRDAAVASEVAFLILLSLFEEYKWEEGDAIVNEENHWIAAFHYLRDAVSCTATFPTALEELVGKEIQVLAHTHGISEVFFPALLGISHYREILNARSCMHCVIINRSVYYLSLQGSTRLPKTLFNNG